MEVAPFSASAAPGGCSNSKDTRRPGARSLVVAGYAAAQGTIHRGDTLGEGVIFKDKRGAQFVLREPMPKRANST